MSWPKGPGVDAAGYATWQKEVIEVKVVTSMGEKFWDTALAQTSEYADRCAAQKAHLVLFDKREGRNWTERIYEQTKHGPCGREITVWGMLWRKGRSLHQKDLSADFGGAIAECRHQARR